MLYLTSKKISFEYEKRGIIFKGRYSAVNLPLEKISEVTIVGAGPFKKLAINMIRDKGTFGLPRYEFNVDDAENWKEKIDYSMQTVIITSQREIKETIKEIVKIRCQYCGMLVDSALSQCPNCGGTIR